MGGQITDGETNFVRVLVSFATRFIEYKGEFTPNRFETVTDEFMNQAQITAIALSDGLTIGNETYRIISKGYDLDNKKFDVILLDPRKVNEPAALEYLRKR